MADRKKFLILVFIFGLSGFSGLIYQSIWASYLKLFLGHSAYAQTLVLAIFMGGMAIGAWVVGKKTDGLKRPILWYAIIEGGIGVFGLVFHGAYVSITNFVFSSIVSGADSAFLINTVKWGTATLMILPQSIMLGATFPLLAAGLVRVLPGENGKTISLLYFSNSLGAVFGVLTSGFVLIGNYGLPGTVAIAGAINVWLAALVWVLNSKWAMDESGFMRASEAISSIAKEDVSKKYLQLLILCAAFTGMASFFYEIGWIRMLSMVLGSSTHSFELMLSGFILGIALGGFWIKGRIASFENPLKVLGYIQLIMGVLAALSLFVYDKTFTLMALLMNALSYSDPGYFLFHMSSHFIVLLLMLPTTICAGMTLPLITYVLMKTKVGERSIGMVYSANTLGSILGILLVVHIILPVLGLKSVIILGALIDVVVGAFLLKNALPSFSIKRYMPPVAMASALVLVSAVFFSMDPQKTASSVYRNGYSMLKSDPIARLDGKTASIDVYSLGKDDEKRVVISTNGKPDASISMVESAPPTLDEITMIMAAALPLSIHDNPERVANIGIGSGLTGHTLLGDPRVSVLDNIEIEQKMVDGAQLFGNKVERSFTDKRSHIHIEDAKTFFSHKNEKYDVIISEPSNPWVSGVSTLFSTEFYDHINSYLEDDGVFVQWLHLYETDFGTVASVMKALGEKFNHYSMYSSNAVDVLIVASQSRESLVIDQNMFSSYTDLPLLSRVGLENVNDIRFHFLASKRVLAPFFEGFDVKPNSDFYPVIDSRAARARFLKSDAIELIGVTRTPYSLENIWPGNDPVYEREPNTIHSESTHFTPSLEAKLADSVYQYYFNHMDSLSEALSTNSYFSLKVLSSPEYCPESIDEDYIVSGLATLARTTLPYWTEEQTKHLVSHLGTLPCVSNSKNALSMVGIFESLPTKDFASVSSLSQHMLEVYENEDRHARDSLIVFLLSVNMYANLLLGESDLVVAAFEKYKAHDIDVQRYSEAIAIPIMYEHAKLEIDEDTRMVSVDN